MNLNLTAKFRSLEGKSYIKNIRKSNNIPVNCYDYLGNNFNCIVSSKDFTNLFKNSFYNKNFSVSLSDDGLENFKNIEFLKNSNVVNDDSKASLKIYSYSLGKSDNDGFIDNTKPLTSFLDKTQTVAYISNSNKYNVYGGKFQYSDQVSQTETNLSFYCIGSNNDSNVKNYTVNDISIDGVKIKDLGDKYNSISIVKFYFNIGDTKVSTMYIGRSDNSVFSDSKNNSVIINTLKCLYNVLQNDPKYSSIKSEYLIINEITPIFNILPENLSCIVKQYSIHPVNRNIIHVDFISIVHSKQYVNVKVPVRLYGDSVGVKKGGILSVYLTSVRLYTAVSSIPSEFTLDIKDLSIGQSVYISNIKIPEGSKILNNLNQMIATVVSSRMSRVSEMDSKKAEKEKAQSK